MELHYKNECLVPSIIEHEDLDSGAIAIGNPISSTSNSNDKRAKFSAQDLLKQVWHCSDRSEMTFVFIVE